MAADNLTPMKQQYNRIKAMHSDCILFFRLGDFYELFFEDAKTASRELELTLTGKDCGLEERAPMCGVPYHAVDVYLSKLVDRGYKVAICEQMEDPKEAKGIVRREVIRVVTPGTNLNMQALEETRNNYLMSIMCVGAQYGIAAADISTGEFYATQLTSSDNDEHLINLIGKYQPSELIYNNAFEDSRVYKTIQLGFDTACTLRSDRDFSSSYVNERKLRTYGSDKFSDPELMLCAVSALIRYADETQTEAVSTEGETSETVVTSPPTTYEETEPPQTTPPP